MIFIIEIYFDAASAGNPGPSSIGIFVKNGGHSKNYSKYIGEYSNHEAEFIALVEALKICSENKFSSCLLKTDSQIVFDSMEKKYVKNKSYEPYLKEALALSIQLSLFFIQWIPSKQNNVADQLARSVLIKRKNNLKQ